MIWGSTPGLDIRPQHAPAALVQRHLTDEAALWAHPGADLRVDPLVEVGALVAQGAPVLRLRHQPRIILCAPMPARVATLDLGPGRRLHEMRFFHEPEAGRHRHTVEAATQTPEDLRKLMQSAGVWPLIQSRPFGRLPSPTEIPAAIFVMLLDTRPGAPSPLEAVAKRMPDLELGLDALCRLTAGAVFLCQPPGADAVHMGRRAGNLQILRARPRHPWGLAGYQVHRHCPADMDRPVWDLQAEDAAGLGELLRTGMVPQTRRIAVGGAAMDRALLFDCQPGADLRGLCHGHVAPGPHRILTGSALDGRVSHWLGARDRQVTALPPAPDTRRAHWFIRALRGASRPVPLIPTAALEQAMGEALPTIPFLRALSADDSEAAIRLGALSFVEEDLALADYVSGAVPRLSGRLRSMLDRMAEEQAP